MSVDSSPHNDTGAAEKTAPVGAPERSRIRRAQALILETELTLVEIALMTGFADQSHFTRRFHRHIGSTPAAYARENGRRRPVRRSCG